MGQAYASPVSADNITAHSIPFEALGHGPTTVVGGLPGFMILDNVWYKDRTFYMLEDEEGQIPEADWIVSLSPGDSDAGTLGVERFSWQDVVANDEHYWEDGGSSVPTRSLSGTTLFFNDGWGGNWSGYKWYYHFTTEAILGSLSALSSVEPIHSHSTYGMVGDDRLEKRGWFGFTGGPKKESYLSERLVIAWDREWDSRYGMSRAVAEALFRQDHLIEPQGWHDLTAGGGWVHFERVLLLDRGTAHRHNPLTKQWLKMAVDAYKLATSPAFFHRARDSFLAHYSIPAPRRKAPGIPVNKVPKVVYIERQGTERRFEDSVHNELVRALRKIHKRGDAKVHFAVLENLEKKKQFAMFADADIVLGIHGNGLTHELWMPEGGTVIEILPQMSFQWDYPPISAVLGHEHIIWQYDKIWPRDQWIPQNAGNGTVIHDGSFIPLEVSSFMSLVHMLVGSMSHSN
ncbi:hypothetical protein IAT38_000963 [Cryptococcus sp. DSM 104549]